MRRLHWLVDCGLMVFLGCQGVTATLPAVPSPILLPALPTILLTVQPSPTLTPPVTVTPAFLLTTIEIETDAWEKEYDGKTGQWVMGDSSTAHSWATEGKMHFERHGVASGQEFAYTGTVDGQSDWSYRPLENLVEIHNAHPFEPDIQYYYGFGSKDLPSLFQFLSTTKCFDAALAGEETWLGALPIVWKSVPTNAPKIRMRRMRVRGPIGSTRRVLLSCAKKSIHRTVRRW